MLKALKTTFLLFLAIGVCLSCGESEEEELVYDILVVNDVSLYDYCDVYLDGTLEFRLEAEDSAAITDVPEGEHTITYKHKGIAKWLFTEDTFNLSRDIELYTKDPSRRDGVDDVEISFIDIEEGSVEISDSTILCKITLRNIPEQLSFNKPLVEINALEYMWGVKFDVNGDGKVDYELSIRHYRFSLLISIGGILSNTQQNAWKKEGGSFKSIASIDASIEGNTITLKADKSEVPDLADITDESKPSFHTYYNDGESTYRDELK